MDFAEAWTALAIGHSTVVSNGQPEPMATPESFVHRVWRSHNFTGQLVEKIDGPPRQLRFDLAPDDNGSVIGYAIMEGVGHTFGVVPQAE